MGYNKAKEKKAWNIWKEKENQLMESYGIEKGIIENLYQFDLKSFNADRRFLQRQYTNSDKLDYAVTKQVDNVYSFEKILDLLENEDLYILLKKMSRIDLMIIQLKLYGYKNTEIASFFQISKSAVSQRIRRIQKKIGKFLD